MTIAYFDCFSGISGDMTLGALVDAGADRAVLDATVEALRLHDEVALEVGHESRGHVGGTRVTVKVVERESRTVPALRGAIEDSKAPDAVKRLSLKAIELLARAESRIHGLPAEAVHLHEIGGADTLVDVVGAFWLLHSLRVDRCYASPLPVPRGRKNGLPLPAPASLRVLEGTGAVLEPVDLDRELVTPTGAAILGASATFSRPAMSLHRIGYGVGSHEAPGNVLGAWIGEEVGGATGVTLIETNLDDMAPNLIAAMVEDLMAAGALDVTVTPTLMKKGRPGQIVAVMSPPDLVARLSEHVLRHSSTLGVRLAPMQRLTADREVAEVMTPWGKARVKLKKLGGQVIDVAPEYEDCRRISQATGLDLREVMRGVVEAGRSELGRQ